MSSTDPIAEMLTIVRNGFIARKETVLIKRSKVNENILDILKKEAFISNYKSIEDKKQGTIKVYLKYAQDKTPALTGIKRISKPGLRVYVKKDEVKSVLGGIGVALISTSSGIMIDKEAKEKNLGGEVLCEAW